MDLTPTTPPHDGYATPISRPNTPPPPPPESKKSSRKIIVREIPFTKRKLNYPVSSIACQAGVSLSSIEKNMADERY